MLAVNLIATDTREGRLACEVIEEFLKNHGCQNFTGSQTDHSK